MAERFLLRCLEDADHTVVEDAALALGVIGSKGTAEGLVKKLAAREGDRVVGHEGGDLHGGGMVPRVPPRRKEAVRLLVAFERGQADEAVGARG